MLWLFNHTTRYELIKKGLYVEKEKPLPLIYEEINWIADIDWI